MCVNTCNEPPNIMVAIFITSVTISSPRCLCSTADCCPPYALPNHTFLLDNTYGSTRHPPRPGDRCNVNWMWTPCLCNWIGHLLHGQKLIRCRQAEGGKPPSGLFMQELSQDDLQGSQHLKTSVKIWRTTGYWRPCQDTQEHGRPEQEARSSVVNVMQGVAQQLGQPAQSEQSEQVCTIM